MTPPRVDPVERIAEALLSVIMDYDTPWDATDEMGRRLYAQGFGHIEDHLQEFLEWVDGFFETTAPSREKLLARYLATLSPSERGETDKRGRPTNEGER